MHFGENPSADDARMPAICARLPRPLISAVDRAGALAGQRRSAVVRELLTDALRVRGLWPPQGGDDA